MSPLMGPLTVIVHHFIFSGRVLIYILFIIYLFITILFPSKLYTCKMGCQQGRTESSYKVDLLKIYIKLM